MRDELIIVPWSDSLIERLGYEPRSEYVETYWLPLFGPTASWVYRRFGLWVAAEDKVTIDVDSFARSIGVGGRRHYFDHTLARLVMFGAARWDGDVLEVRRRLPRLSARMVSQLPAVLRHRHAGELRSSETLAVG